MPTPHRPPETPSPATATRSTEGARQKHPLTLAWAEQHAVEALDSGDFEEFERLSLDVAGLRAEVSDVEDVRAELLDRVRLHRPAGAS